jgi:hypothetical protein
MDLAYENAVLSKNKKAANKKGGYLTLLFNSE